MTPPFVPTPLAHTVLPSPRSGSVGLPTPLGRIGQCWAPDSDRAEVVENGDLGSKFTGAAAQRPARFARLRGRGEGGKEERKRSTGQ
nr:hypothetical protein CFP56_78364 [Quercus suber]